MKMTFNSEQSQKSSVGLLIPGLGISYLESIESLKDDPIFQNHWAKAGMEHFINRPPPLLKEDNRFLQDNLINQKISYVVNCSMGDLLKKRGVLPEFIIGYSMGINVALYIAGHCSFETGLRILEKKFLLIRDHCSLQRKKYGMALLLGLKEDEIRGLLFKEVEQEMDIAVYNGMRNFVIAGEKESLDVCLKKAVKIGAIGIKPILTEHPYHTSLLKGITHELHPFLKTLNYSVPSSKILSLNDGTIIGGHEVVDAIVKEIHTPLHFDLAINNLINNYKISVFYETGPPESMRKLLRYINREVKVHHFPDREVQ